MKFNITFKTPDLDMQFEDNMYETDDGYRYLKEEVKKALDKFIKYDEIITVEFDTETKTVKVLEV